MKLEVGKHYLSAGGEIIEIARKKNNCLSIFCFVDTSGISYTKKGKMTFPAGKFDLIAEIPTSLHQYLIQTIKDYHTDLDFKATVDNVFSHS